MYLLENYTVIKQVLIEGKSFYEYDARINIMHDQAIYMPDRYQDCMPDRKFCILQALCPYIPLISLGPSCQSP